MVISPLKTRVCVRALKLYSSGSATEAEDSGLLYSSTQQLRWALHSHTRCRADKIPPFAGPSNSFENSPRWSHDKLLGPRLPASVYIKSKNSTKSVWCLPPPPLARGIYNHRSLSLSLPYTHTLIAISHLLSIFYLFLNTATKKINKKQETERERENKRKPQQAYTQLTHLYNDVFSISPALYSHLPKTHL